MCEQLVGAKQKDIRNHNYGNCKNEEFAFHPLEEILIIPGVLPLGNLKGGKDLAETRALNCGKRTVSETAAS